MVLDESDLQLQSVLLGQWSPRRRPRAGLVPRVSQSEPLPESFQPLVLVPTRSRERLQLRDSAHGMSGLPLQEEIEQCEPLTSQHAHSLRLSTRLRLVLSFRT